MIRHDRRTTLAYDRKDDKVFDNSFKQEIDNEEKATRNRRILLLAAIPVLLLAFSAMAYALGREPSDNYGSSEVKEKAERELAEFGQRCETGIKNFDARIVQLHQRIDSLSVEIAALPNIRAEAQQRTKQLWEQIGQVNDEYREQYAAGIFTLEELNKLTGEKINYAVHEGLRIEKEAEAEIRRSSDLMRGRLDKIKEQMDSTNSDRTKLQVCVDQVKAGGGLSATDITNFEALIAASERPLDSV